MILRRRLLIEMMVLVGAILLLTALGPFGTYAQPIATRYVRWALFLIGGYAFFRPVLAAGNALASQSGLPRPLTIAAACLFGSLPTSVIVALVFAGFRWREVTIGTLAATYPQVLIVGATITIVQLLVRRAHPGEADDAGAKIEDAPPIVEHAAPPPGGIAEPSAATAAPAVTDRARSFLDQLPPHLGRDIICLENEDHYVRAHTPLGNALILMRMRDAVDQLDHVEGERVHRGWWVARGAVSAVVRQDRNVRLRLQDGREVPVARASVPTLRASGWFADLPADA